MPGHGHAHDPQNVHASEEEFTQATHGVEKSLKDLHWHLEHFDPLNKTGKSGQGKHVKRRANQDDDDEDEVESLRERFEAYKMVRKIEPELPPLTPLPPLSVSKRLPDTPLIEYNLSQEAMEKTSKANRRHAIQRMKVHKEQQRNAASTRREAILSVSRQIYEQALQQKKKQAEDVIAARFAGGGKADMRKEVSKEVVAEKWIVMYVIAAFLKSAHEDVKFTHKPPEERQKIIAERREAGIFKRSDDYHLRCMQLDEYMQDRDLTCRLFMLAQMVQRRVHVRACRNKALVLHKSLVAWQPRANMFLKFQDFSKKVQYLQAWWRRMRQKLKDILDNVAKRWEKIERMGTSGYHAVVPHSKDIEVVDTAVRTVFLENELRARRFYVLARMGMWKEEAERWRENDGLRQKGYPMDLDSVPHRPSYLPCGHLFNESADKPCCEGCLGRQGDNEILAMIKAARSNPKGGGWKEIPQKKAGTQSKPKKAKKTAEDEGEQADPEDASAEARLFGEVTADDLVQWGVDPSNLPAVGQKPGADEGEGFYPT